MAIDLNKYQGVSKWLKAEDLTSQDMDAAIVTICEVFEESFDAREGKPGEERLCIRLKEFEKPLGLNVTNTRALMEILGDDTDTWEGRKIKLRVSSAMNPQTGKMGDCLRIVAAPAKPKVGEAKPKLKVATEEDDPYADE